MHLWVEFFVVGLQHKEVVGRDEQASLLKAHQLIDRTRDGVTQVNIFDPQVLSISLPEIRVAVIIVVEATITDAWVTGPGILWSPIIKLVGVAIEAVPERALRLSTQINIVAGRPR